MAAVAGRLTAKQMKVASLCFVTTDPHTSPLQTIQPLFSFHVFCQPFHSLAHGENWHKLQLVQASDRVEMAFAAWPASAARKRGWVLFVLLKKECQPQPLLVFRFLYVRVYYFVFPKACGTLATYLEMTHIWLKLDSGTWKDDSKSNTKLSCRRQVIKSTFSSFAVGCPLFQVFQMPPRGEKNRLYYQLSSVITILWLCWR